MSARTSPLRVAEWIIQLGIPLDTRTRKYLPVLRDGARHRSADGLVLAAAGRRIVSGAQDNTARVWDAETGSCLEVLEDWGDVYAIPTAAAGCFHRALTRNQETVIEVTETARVVAWFGDSLHPITTHPSCRQWAGGVRSHRCLI